MADNGGQRSASLRAVLESQAARAPDDVYLIAPETGRRLSFSQLRQSALDLAGRLAEAGLRPGERVGLLMQNGLAAVTSFVGVMAAGAVVTPLRLLAQAEHLAYVLDHADCRLVLTAPERMEILERAMALLARPIAVLAVDPDGGEDGRRPATGAAWP